MRLQHPHDHFVREFFSEPARAREFLSAVLPAGLSETLDWAKLRGDRQARGRADPFQDLDQRAFARLIPDPADPELKIRKPGVNRAPGFRVHPAEMS